MAVDNIVIVGGGLAGATAAKTLRAEGYEGPVTLLAEEPHAPYLRPPLSKEYLLGKDGEEALPVVPADWYAENDVELRLSVPATALDTGARTVDLADGARLTYSALLLATGARPRLHCAARQRPRRRDDLPDAGGQPPAPGRPGRRRPERGDGRLGLDWDGTGRSRELLRQHRDPVGA